MRSEFIKAATRRAAEEKAQWSCITIPVGGGFRAFESWRDAEVWLGQDWSGDLMDYETGEFIRRATPEDYLMSVTAARSDGGAGVILIDGRRCFVRE